jgi:hypothetical protein
VDAIADTVGGDVAKKLIVKIKQGGSFGYTAVFASYSYAMASVPDIHIPRSPQRLGGLYKHFESREPKSPQRRNRVGVNFDCPLLPDRASSRWRSTLGAKEFISCVYIRGMPGTAWQTPPATVLILPSPCGLSNDRSKRSAKGSLV